MTRSLSSLLLDGQQQNNSDFTIDTEEANLLFRLLRLGDLSMSLAWHSIWHGLEKTP